MSLNKKISTICIQSNNNYNNQKRLEDLNKIVGEIKSDLFIFPAGYFSTNKKPPKKIFPWMENKIHSESIICVGVDGRIQKPWPKDQITIAVSKNNIIACGRKFYPTNQEKGLVKLAKNDKIEEEGLKRIFDYNKNAFYMAVCYDSFGIRKKKIPNPNVDFVINNIHAFYPVGEGNSGENYFARHGLAGLSKQWNCPVFAAAVFFNRKIPQRWPTRVMWNQGKKSTTKWKYNENPIEPKNIQKIKINEGEARIDTYKI